MCGLPVTVELLLQAVHLVLRTACLKAKFAMQLLGSVSHHRADVACGQQLSRAGHQVLGGSDSTKRRRE